MVTQMRIAVLWYSLNGYLNACLKALAALDSTEIFVVHKRAHHQAPFESSQFDWLPQQMYWESEEELEGLQRKLEDFAPDAIVAVGWRVQRYRKVMTAFRARSVRIMTMDNNWHNTPKQWLGIATAPIFIKPIADAIWVPGERQAVFASRLGYSNADILRGLYSCDHGSFSKAHQHRLGESSNGHKRFLFVGRFSPEKGIRCLLDGYRAYRDQSSDPWTLTCCGTGPLRGLIEATEGVEVRDFTQPAELPELFQQASCFVLPSIFEPWGVVVHEAAAAGLPLILSNAVGSSPHLLLPYQNGYIFDSGNPAQLARAFATVTSLDQEAYSSLRSSSYALSCLYTPEHWAHNLNAFVAARVHGLRP